MFSSSLSSLWKQPKNELATKSSDSDSSPDSTSTSAPLTSSSRLLHTPSPSPTMPVNVTSHPLTAWEYAQLPSKSFPDLDKHSKACQLVPCSKFPTSVHVELLAAGKIPDPYKDLNEAEVQWINEADWIFKTEFATPAAVTDLVFGGLDTYCTVLLNGKEILQAQNMFISHRVNVSKHLSPEGEKNVLELRFGAPLLAAKAEEAANGGPMKLWNGDSSRLYSRKAQYGWGWDWGPVVMTTGPWKEVTIETYDYRISDLRVDADVRQRDALNGHAKDVVGNPADGIYDDCFMSVAGFEVLPAKPESFRTVYTLTDAEDNVVKQATAEAGGDLPKWELGTAVKAWFPIHYGEQPLYKLHVGLVDAEGKTLAETSQRVAFRHVEVVQEPLPKDVGGGSSFLFEVNGIRIFCGGSNWIPADNYLTEISEERYRAWVELLIKGNQNMLRVWGGGIYEVEALYDICDERGVLVWQDFMFGCGLYPSYPSLNDSVKVEAEQAVSRLRAHPSVVIFAGNNEDYQVAESQGVVDYDDNSGDYMHTKFPARHIYEIVLPEVVHRLSGIFYWPSSPYGGKTSGDLTVGDVHQWNVWHGTQEPWANWDILAGRFVSEFGMQGYPNIRTVNEWFSPEELKTQHFPQSRISVNHNKADGFERRLELYLMENFRHAFDMASYVYYTQAMQAETLAAAYRLWRRNWKGRGKELTSGALVWQINDCWPCVSWAICDYYLRPKPAFYAIAREMRPYTVGMARKEIQTPRDETTMAFYTIRHEIQLWGCNSTLSSKDATIELVSYDLEKGEVDRRTFPVTLAPNASTEVWIGDVPGQPVRTNTAEVPRPIVVQARLLLDNDTDEVLARYSNWPEPWKYLTFPDPGLDIAVDGDKVTVTVSKPVKGLILDTDLDDGAECEWSDQALDMFPGDTQVVIAKGLKGRKVTARYIGDGTA